METREKTRKFSSIQATTDSQRLCVISVCREFLTSTLQQDVKQVVHLLTIHTILLLTDSNIQC